MTNLNANPATVIGLPEGALERLALFAEWTGTMPPACLVIREIEGLAFSEDLLVYANKQGLSLDWFWLGDERSLVMSYHNRERAA